MRVLVADHALQFGTQFLCIAQAAVQHVQRKRAIDRARYMAGDRVQRLHLTAEPLARAGIDQPARCVLEA
ncbi:hypothetical protein D3C75_1357740 [compost metagenome]